MRELCRLNLGSSNANKGQYSVWECKAQHRHSLLALEEDSISLNGESGFVVAFFREYRHRWPSTGRQRNCFRREHCITSFHLERNVADVPYCNQNNWWSNRRKAINCHMTHLSNRKRHLPDKEANACQFRNSWIQLSSRRHYRLRQHEKQLDGPRIAEKRTSCRIWTLRYHKSIERKSRLVESETRLSGTGFSC